LVESLRYYPSILKVTQVIGEKSKTCLSF